MIGQANLIKVIDNLKSLPNSILLLGERGSEQNELIDYICNKQVLNKMDITDSINNQLLDEINESHVNMIYIINLSNTDDKVQNMLLKTFEEPSPYSHFILISYNEADVLETIKTRSYILKCDRYTVDQLSNLTSNEYTLKICKTPGLIETANLNDINSLVNLCENMVNRYKGSAMPRALNVTNMINFDDEYSKYDLYLFMLTYRYCLINRMKKDYNKYYEYCLRCIDDLNNHIFKMAGKSGKQRYFDNFLMRLRDGY